MTVDHHADSMARPGMAADIATAAAAALAAAAAVDLVAPAIWASAVAVMATR